MHIETTTIVLLLISTILVMMAILYRQLASAKDALDESYAKHKAIFDTTMEAIIIFDDNHYISEFNLTASKLFGYDRKEPLGKHVLKLIAPEYHQTTIDYIKSGSKKPYESIGVKKDGTTFPILTSGQFISVNGKSIRVSVIIDLTELKQTQHKLEDLNLSLENRVQDEVEKNRFKEEKLFQQSRLAKMGEMISMIAHQWRQPLNAISLTVTNIESKIEMEKFDLQTEEGSSSCTLFINKKLRRIDEYVQGLSSTIDDFRNFYNPNKMKKTLPITDPIKQALNIMSSSLINHKITISKKYQTQSSLLLYDGEFMQVILNILKNATDQLTSNKIENPTIMIETYKEGNIFIVKISDNAGGIKEEHLATIFDPYFSTKGEKNGTGLGLYMSKTIIEKHHGGKLHVQNSKDGATFIIELKSDTIDKN